MKEKEVYKFCPKCGGNLTLQSKHSEHLRCEVCGFSFYLNPKTCVSAIITKDKKVLLGRRAFDPMKDFWDFPGGFVEKGESLEEGLKREVLEELRVKIKKFEYFISDPDQSNYELDGIEYDLLDTFFMVEIEGEPTYNDDVAEIRYFSLDNLPEKITPLHKKVLGVLREKNLR